MNKPGKTGRADTGAPRIDVGLSGTATLTVRNGGRLELVNVAASTPNSSPRLILGDAGGGRNKTGNGGNGTFVVSSGSALTANTAENGPNGASQRLLCDHR